MTTFLRLTFHHRDRNEVVLTDHLVNADQIATMQAAQYFTGADVQRNDDGNRWGTKIVWADSRRPHSIVTSTLDELAVALNAFVVPARDESPVCDHCHQPVHVNRCEDPDLDGEWKHDNGEWHCGTWLTAKVNGSTRAFPREDDHG